MSNFNSNSIRFVSLLFAVAALFALTASNVYADRDKHDHKAVICHIPPGNPDNMHTIEVGEAAVDAHMAHGDMMGSCAGESDEFAEADEHEEDEEHEESAGTIFPTPSSAKVYSMRSIYGQ
ncbi:hypothetical protein F3F96_06685 [Mariprofundus sp. NF]|uniref:hypothetical protein n=1 Tax=Mariprofundus sp. NF TaxID=2608716 RepID=UPI0015A426CC|nr:hypothetical protein [Mariprofundus sp. NF]NWF38818.1 hypothetical protein [Mariprofundus sp. NF]